MTIQIQIFLEIKHHDVLTQEVNEWLKEAELQGHTIKDIKFQNNDGSEHSVSNTSVMIIYELYEPDTDGWIKKGVRKKD